MMEKAVEDAVSKVKAKVKAQKVHESQDAHSKATSPASSSRQQAVDKIRAMLDADPEIQLRRAEAAERVAKVRERMTRGGHRDWRSCRGTEMEEGRVGWPGGSPASTLDKGTHHRSHRSRYSQSLDDVGLMRKESWKMLSHDWKGGAVRTFPCSNIDKVREASSKAGSRAATMDALARNDGRPMSPTTEFLLSETFDAMLSIDSTIASGSVRGGGASPTGSTKIQKAAGNSMRSVFSALDEEDAMAEEVPPLLVQSSPVSQGES